MDISLDKKTNTEGHIKIRLNPGDYQQRVDEKIKEYARKANIKGFRRGKVPPGVIRNLYGKSIKVQEINHMVSHGLNDYIKENNINIIGDPIPEKKSTDNIDWESQVDFEFDFAIGMVNEFKYDISSKVKVKRYSIKVDDKNLQSTLEDVKKQYGQMTNPVVVEEGDAIYGKFTKLNGPKDDQTVESLIELTELEKSVQKSCLGKKKGDIVNFDLQSATRNPETLARWFKLTIQKAKDLSGRVDFEIKNINRTIPAEVNQELYDKVFGKGQINSEQEFNEKLLETIQGNYDHETAHMLDHHIKEHLLKSTKIETPDDFLRRWLLISNEGKIEEKDIEENFDHYVNDLKWNLISNRIIKDESLQVQNEEVVDEAKKQIMAQLGGPAVVEAYKEQLDGIVQNFLKAENGKNYLRIHNQLKEMKILKVIRERITVVEKSVKLEEFKKIASA